MSVTTDNLQDEDYLRMDIEDVVVVHPTSQN